MGMGIFGGVTPKQVKMASTTWATAFTDSSHNFVDVTNATCTITGLTASSTYIIEGIISTYMATAAADYAQAQILIDGTVSNIQGNSCSAGASLDIPTTLTGQKSVTGATSYIVKLQAKSNGSTVKVNQQTLTSGIQIKAVEQ